jgi:uncharacterized protein (UPF0147 family)
MTVELNDILQGMRDKREEARQLFIKINEDKSIPEDLKTALSNILEELMDSMTLVLLKYKLIQCRKDVEGDEAKRIEDIYPGFKVSPDQIYPGAVIKIDRKGESK